MSFKKYGGLKFAATNNIVKSHFSNSDNPQISNYLGQSNSKIVSASEIDMSDNSILNVKCIQFYNGTSICTGIPIDISASNWGDYLYWGNNAWAIGDTNITLGKDAGKVNQGINAVALGNGAGKTDQSNNAIAIGYNAGQTSQDASAVAIGAGAGNFGQGLSAVAIGFNAGATGQGQNAIAIGANAGKNNQAANTIVINAQGPTGLNTTTENALYIAPIRDAIGASGSYMFYNSGTKEVTYDSTIVPTPSSTQTTIYDTSGTFTISLGAGKYEIMCIGAGGSCGAYAEETSPAKINSGGSGAAGSSFIITLYLSSTANFTLILGAGGSGVETRLEFASGYYGTPVSEILAIAYTGGDGTAATITNPGSGGIAAVPALIPATMTGLTGKGNEGSDGKEGIAQILVPANQTGINFMFYNTGNGNSSYGAGGYNILGVGNKPIIVAASGGACIITKYSIS